MSHQQFDQGRQSQSANVFGGNLRLQVSRERCDGLRPEPPRLRPEDYPRHRRNGTPASEITLCDAYNYHRVLAPSR